MNELTNAIKETESPNQVGDSARASGSTASQSFLDEVWGKKCLSKKGGCPDGPSELPDLPSFPGQIKPDPDYPIKPYEPSKPIKPYEPIKPEQPRQCVQDDDGAIACGVPIGPERPRLPGKLPDIGNQPDISTGKIKNLPGLILYEQVR